MDYRASSPRGVWQQVDTTNDGVLYSFVKTNFTKNFVRLCDNFDSYRYGPTSNGSLYIKIKSDNPSIKTLCGDSFKDQGDVYVSVNVLLYMGTQDFRDFSRYKDDVSRKEKLPDLAAVQCEEFVGALMQQPPPGSIPFKQEIIYPYRSRHGIVGPASISKDTSINAWNTVRDQFLGRGQAGSGKPPRHLNFELTNPLVVGLMNIRTRMLLSRIGDAFFVYQWFESEIEAVNNARKGDQDKWELQHNMVLDNDQWKQRDLTGYILLSKDPFDLYATYIHQTDWNRYMGNLPIRTFPFKELPVFKNLLDGLANIGDELQERLSKVDEDTGESFMQEYLGVNPEQLGEDDHKKTTKKKGAARKEENSEKIQAGIIAMYRNAKAMGTGKLVNFLDATKMEAATSKRTGEQGQSAVMAGYSASDLANDLGWGAEKLATGFSPAEWLHLSAFSYGGFEGGFSTSQTPDNLVFGTSETNSLMTRYEMAWQNLLRTEHKIAFCLQEYGYTPYVVEGTLEITVNDPKTPIRYDAVIHDPDGRDQYVIRDFQFDSGEINLVKQNASQIPVDEIEEGFPNVCQIYDAGTTQRQMLKLAYRYPFLAYSIKYDITLERKSYVLGVDCPKSVNYFYPFQRPFFHTAESRLDDAIFRTLEMFAWQDIRNMVDDGTTNAEAAQVDDIGDHKEFLFPKHRRDALKEIDAKKAAASQKIFKMPKNDKASLRGKKRINNLRLLKSQENRDKERMVEI